MNFDPQRIVIALLVFAGYFAFLFVLITVTLPTEMRDVVIGAGGVLGGQFVVVVSWFFGSSSGSSGKDATIEKLSNKP